MSRFVPVVFSDFVLVLPRLEGVIDGDGTFILHPGAELFIDKRPTSRMGNLQQWRMLDYRTNKVRLEPGDSHSDFFDLGAFLPNATPGVRPSKHSRKRGRGNGQRVRSNRRSR